MPIAIRIKRGVGGAPATLLRGEIAYDETNQKLYIGSGDSGADDANGLPIAQNIIELTTPPTVLEDLANISVGSGASDGDVLVYDGDTGDWVAEAVSIAWDSVTSKPASFPPSTHASSHHTGGGDAIAPADIGAAAATHSHAWDDITSGVPSTFTPTAHKASHATGGTDALSPSDIGAAALSHTHSASDITSGLATVATTGAYSDLSGTPSLATVATTGAYSDLSGTPTLGTAAASATSDFAAASHSHAAADITSGTLDIARIPTGSTSTTVCIGNDSRLSDNRDPNSHTHGNITNAGAIGSTSGLPVKTGTSGVLEAGAFGTSAGEFAEGNHTHAWTDITSKPSDFTPSAHKASHATGGTDALSPSDIGAAAASHTHSDATTSVAGFLSASDKTKLDGIASGATANAGTVTSVTAGDGLSGGTVDTSGTIAVDLATDPGLEFSSGKLRAKVGAGLKRDSNGIGIALAAVNPGLVANQDGFAVDFGTSAAEVAAGNHGHGNITTAGAIGSTSGLPVKTGASGVLEAGAFGTASGEFAEGNHSHAWDDITSKPSTFTPAAHNHTVTLEISGFIEAPEAKTYVISPAIPAAITITQLKAQTSAGTVDLAVHDDGTLVTGCSLADAGTTLASLASAISESVAAGSKLALVVSDLQSSPADLAFTIHYTVTSANNS